MDVSAGGELAERDAMLSALMADLRYAARIIDQFDAFLHTAWDLLGEILEDASRASRSGLILRPTRSLITRKTSASDAVRATTGAMAFLPHNLLPEAVELWRNGLSVGIANRMARAGFRTFVEVLALRPSRKLRAIQGLGAAVVQEVSRALERKGIPDESPTEPTRFVAVAPSRQPKERRTIDWADVAEQTREALRALEGSGTMTELIRRTGLPQSRVKRGLRLLEGYGVVRRTGNRRSTRYHLGNQDS